MTNDGSRSSQIERVEMLLAEYRDQQVRGEAPSMEEFISLHPELSELLRQRLAGERTAGPVDATVNWDSNSANAAGTPSAGSDQRTQHFESTPAPQAAPHTELGPGAHVGRYRLVRELGRGGMGVVYEAEHLDSQRRVAIKLLSPSLYRTDETVERFLKEASLAASLSHPRSTFVYEAGKDGDQFFTVMELMPGKTLSDLVKEEGPLPIARAVDYILDAVDGLEAAHAAGIVHRDVKPSNCFVTEDGRVKIGDFGLSKSLVADSSLTMTGTFLGTPQFAAPEQIRHQQVDERTDIFALAASLFYLLAGTAPFSGSPAAVIAQIVADKPPALKSVCRGAPSALGKVLDRGMQKDPKRRYQTMAAFREALVPFSSRSSFAAVGRRMAAFALDIALITGLSFLVVATMHDRFSLDAKLPLPPFAFTQLLLMIPYFTVCEGLWGRTIGKWLFGLRVTSVTGERPGIVRALTRSTLVPGICYVTVTIWRDVVLTEQYDWNLFEANVDVLFWRQLFTILQAVTMGSVCLTMRRSNGYRGVHEFLSSTRVVEPATSMTKTSRMEFPRTLSVVKPGMPAAIGEFRIVGQLGENGPVTIYEGIDDALGRAIWIYTSRDASALDVPANRASVVRAARPHWLRNGEENGLYWFAVEAVVGSPFLHVETLPWDEGRRIVAETARELAASTRDQTLPAGLDEHHLWVKKEGGIKLIDHPWWMAADAVNDGWEPAPRLLKRVIDNCCRGREAPGSALDLSADFEKTLSDDMTKVAARVVAATERPAKIRWDDRLSVLLVTMATEALVFLMLATVVGLCTGRYLGFLPINVRYLVTVLITVIPIWIVAIKLPAGGLAFGLCDFEVRRLNGQRAAAGRRVLRSTWAWLPLVVEQSIFGTWSGYFVSPEFDRYAAGTGDNMWVVILGIMCSTLVALFGALASLLSPRRGIQDWLSGTYLVRK